MRVHAPVRADSGPRVVSLTFPAPPSTASRPRAASAGPEQLAANAICDQVFQLAGGRDDPERPAGPKRH